MSYTLDEKIESFVASGDLSLMQGRLVALLTNANLVVGAAGASNALAPFGVLLNKPTNGQDASVVIGGVTMVRVGAAVQAGNKLTSAASGWAIPAVQGVEATKNVIGEVMIGVASGMLAPARIERYVLSNSVA